MSTWAEEEFGGAALGDRRLNRRLIKLATRFADKPTASIPAACADWAETQAVYRFFDQSRDGKRGLGWQDILAPHIAQTEARMRQHPVVLCLQDTTELDFDGQAIAGLGPLSYEAQRGMYLHPTYAVTPEREPLGVTDAWMWGARAQGRQQEASGPARKPALDRRLRAHRRNRTGDAGHAPGLCRRPRSRHPGTHAARPRFGHACGLADPFPARSQPSRGWETVGTGVRRRGFLRFVRQSLSGPWFDLDALAQRLERPFSLRLT